MTPLIGITAHGRNEVQINSKFYDQCFTSPPDYVDAVRRAGGIPILIPAGDPNWRTIVDRMDGIILAGGSDINPKRYDGPPEHDAYTRFDDERDETDFAITHYIIKTNKPTLAICRGMQVLNVALGGTMHAHIPDILDADMHRNNGLWTTHDVEVESGSQLAKVMGAEVINTYSGHHQAINRIGDGLRVVAKAADGIVEALAHESHSWLLAVQWHPEISAKNDPTQQALFNGLVAVSNTKD